jgi:hypothetical protein
LFCDDVFTSTIGVLRLPNYTKTQTKILIIQGSTYYLIFKDSNDKESPMNESKSTSPSTPFTTPL